MELITKVHLGAVLATMLQELGSWSWQKPFCVYVFVFFLIGLIPQFLLLRMKWNPWVISVILGGLIIVCDFTCMLVGGQIFDLLTLMEMLFISALTGAGLAGAVHIFWEIFKKRDDDEDSVWMLRSSQSKREDK